MMKNVQVIDDADNCSYDVYALTDDEFKMVFPQEGQQIEFIELAVARAEQNNNLKEFFDMLENIWARYVEKDKIQGIHGTLFYGKAQLIDYFPSKRWDVNPSDLEDILKNL